MTHTNMTLHLSLSTLRSPQSLNTQGTLKAAGVFHYLNNPFIKYQTLQGGQDDNCGLPFSSKCQC